MDIVERLRELAHEYHQHCPHYTEAAAEIEHLRAQLTVVMEEKQKQVNYWGDRCCKAESQQNQMFAALQALVREQRDWESPTLDRARAAVTAVEDKP